MPEFGLELWQIGVIIVLLLICGWIVAKTFGPIKPKAKKKKMEIEERLRAEIERRKRTLSEYADEVMVKVYDMTNEQIAKLDNRIRMLDALIMEAERVKNELKEVIAELKHIRGWQ
jgi:uncharacterized membrane protein YhiD involved in acid resistance